MSRDAEILITLKHMQSLLAKIAHATVDVKPKDDPEAGGAPAQRTPQEGNASPEFPGLHKAGIEVLQRLKVAIDSAFAEKRWTEVAELSQQYTALHEALK